MFDTTIKFVYKMYSDKMEFFKQLQVTRLNCTVAACKKSHDESTCACAK